MQQLNLEQKLLRIVYLATRGYKPPLKPNLKHLAYELSTTQDAIRQALNRLLRKGQVKYVNKYNRPYHEPAPIGKRFIKHLMDSNSVLPWDKKNRLRTAYKLGCRLSSLRRTVHDLQHLVHIELDGDGKPIEIRLSDECEALIYLGDDPIHDVHAWEPYLKYVKGYRKPKRTVVRDHAKRPTLKHRILIRLINSNGVMQAPHRHVRHLGCQRRSYDRAVSQLAHMGLVTKSANGIQLRDAAQSASFLAPTGVRPTRPITTTNPISPRTPLAVVVPFGNATREIGKQLPTSVTVFNQSPLPPPTTATDMWLGFLVVREILTAEMYRMSVQYAKHYDGGQARIMDTKRAISEVDEEAIAAYKHRRGVMWGKQMRIIRELLTRFRDQLGLSGVVDDAIIRETARRIRWALPEVEDPDRDLADQLTSWMDTDFPVDELMQGLLRLFIECSGSQTIAEFVCRGGLDLAFRLMDWTQLPNGCVKHRAGWEVLSYIGYIERYPFQLQYEDRFPNITSWDMTRKQSYCTGESMVAGLRLYMGLIGFPLTSLTVLKPIILKALTARYPTRDEDTQGIVVRSVWEDPETHIKLGDLDDYEVLCDWVNEYWVTDGEAPEDGYAKYSLQWYEGLLERAKDYGLPGDVEALREKVAALREWPRASREKQGDVLARILYKPTRYEEPKLSWAQWDQLVKYGRLVKVDNDMLIPADDEYVADLDE